MFAFNDNLILMGFVLHYDKFSEKLISIFFVCVNLLVRRRTGH